jgi:hypothetical protein
MFGIENLKLVSLASHYSPILCGGTLFLPHSYGRLSPLALSPRLLIELISAAAYYSSGPYGPYLFDFASTSEQG